MPECEACGKGQCSITIIDIGNIDRILVCEICDHKTTIRKVPE